MRLCALSLVSLLPPLFLSPVVAIFADEAYQIDYHYPLIGLPQPHNTFFHRPSANSKAALIYTLSERNIIGAVNPKDGVLLWRQRLLDRGQNKTTLGFLKAGEGADVVISAVEGNVQAWDVIDGRLAWESKQYGEVKVLEILTKVEHENDALVAYDAGATKITVKRLAASTGGEIWTYEDTSGNTPFALVPSGDVIYYMSLHSGLMGSYKIHVTQLDVLSGEKSTTQPAQPADNEVTSKESIVFVGNTAETPLLVWTDKALKIVKINIIGSKQVTTVNVAPKSGEVVNKIVVHAAGSSSAHPHFLIHYQSKTSNWAEVFHIQNQKASKAFDLPNIGGIGAFSACSLASEVYLIRYTSSEIELYSSKTATVLAQWSIQNDASHIQEPTHGISEVIMRAGAKYSLRSALAMKSGDWDLVRNGDRLWSRQEGLAGIVAAAFVDSGPREDLLKALASESQKNLLSAYVHRVIRHVKQLQYLPAWFQSLPDRILPDFLGSKNDLQTQSLSNEGFGFSKIVVVATERGRLAALDAGQHGKVLWSVQAVELPNGQLWNVLSIDAEESSIVIHGNAGELLRASTSTGSITNYKPGVMTSLKTSIAVSGSHGLNELIPVNRDGSLGSIANADLADGTVVVTEGDDRVIRGWRLTKSGKSTLAWQFVPGSGEVIQSVQPPPLHDPVASIGKALGDRNVLYKYLNPNILLITAITTEMSRANFYLVDSISGAILYSVAHNGIDTRQPISSTLTENWLAYSFFSESNSLAGGTTQIEPKAMKGYQLVVSELFESQHPNDRGPFGESTNFSSVRPLFTRKDDIGDYPHVISETFLLPGPISHMTTTSTLQGITPRSLLCVLPQANALMSIPRHFLDPRRPVGRDPTPMEAEEGLFRYSPLLEFEAKWLLSHKRDLLGISQVVTSPSKLESTSLVFAYGDVDIFGTRVSPIGSFDMLGKGFSKLQLIGTVVALAIGTSILAPFVKRKQINGQWKA